MSIEVKDSFITSDSGCSYSATNNLRYAEKYDEKTSNWELRLQLKVIITKPQIKSI